MALIIPSGPPPPPGDPPKPRPYVTHDLACGCQRLSSGVYLRHPKCGYTHMDVLARDDHQARLVSFCCGCTGFCYCGNENKLREVAAEKKAEAERKAKREKSSRYGKDGPDGT